MGRRQFVAAAACSATLLVAATRAHAADFYVDPASGSEAGDGSEQKPWKTLEAVVDAGHFDDAIHAGDTVWLRSGNHGALSLRGGNWATPLTIAAAEGQTPELASASLDDVHGLVLKGVSISPSFGSGGGGGTLVEIGDSSSDVVV